MLCSANIWLGLKRLHVGAHIPSGVVGGPLNSRPAPMKHLVICILSLPASNPPQLIHAIRSRVRHLAPRCVLRSRSGHNGKRGRVLLANAGIDAFCHEGCNAAHIRTFSFPHWDFVLPFSSWSFSQEEENTDDDENDDDDGDNLKREQWKSGRLGLLIHRVSLGLVLILNPLKTFPSFLSSFDKNNFKKPQVGPSSMNPWSLSSLLSSSFLLWFHLFPIVVSVPVQDSGMQI